MTAEDAAFTALAEYFAGDPRITLPAAKRGSFGSNGFRVEGKIFAMRVNGKLTVKLPKEEVDAAVAKGHGERLTMGNGRVMKEWLVVHAPPPKWKAFAERALAFVRADGKRDA